ncbi:MAG: DUF2808 domain-containing protein [Leptolyngbyaceae cyanobacterium bins.59]|nr:DUF2808 domain-containing protein [Leptolyngbyaceae cyanobacterium bins.59]
MTAKTYLFGSMIALTAGLWGFPSQAVQFRDGTVHFVQPPRLLSASTTQKSAYAWGATHFFSLEVPANAGEPLQRVTIAPYQAPDSIYYLLRETEAFEGQGWQGGPLLTIREATQDPQTQAVTVVFDPPVPPGKMVTIGLRPRENPSIGSVYLFGITAYPAGEKAQGQFLGYGRIHFYDRDFSFRRFPWFR